MTRIARAQQCDDQGCDVAHLLVRGTHVSFISTEAAKKYAKQNGGRIPRATDEYGVETTTDERVVHPDIVIPTDFVLVHDTKAALLNRCELYLLRWRKGGAGDTSLIHPDDVQAAHDYFGSGYQLQHGSVELPDGKWERVAKVAFIRYTRQGQHAAKYEHEFEPPAWIYDCTRPLSWKLKLPNGCIVDDRGFVRP